MTVLVWIVEGTWHACVDAVKERTDDVTLLHVSGHDVPEAAHGAFAGLLGRGHRERDPGTEVEHLATTSGRDLLDAAAARLGRPCATVELAGRVEREVVAAAADAELLVVARDGDHRHPGPKSLGPASRYVVDHATCPVLLVWPAEH